MLLCALLTGPTFYPVLCSPQLREELRINVGGNNSNAPNQSDGIALAQHQGRFVVAWTEQAGTGAATQDIHFAASSDDGLSFSTPVRVDLGEPANASDSDRPEIAITDSGSIVVAFEDVRASAPSGGSTEDLLYNRSVDGGLTWLAAALPLNTLTYGAHQSSDVDRAALATSGERIYAVWEEDMLGGLQGPEELWFNRSLDGGASFGTAFIVSGSGSEDVDDPALSAWGAQVLIAFVDNSNGANDDTFALYSGDEGQSFLRQSLESSSAGISSEVRIARDGALLCVLWRDDSPAKPGPAGVHLAVSQDGGHHFGAEIGLTPTLEDSPAASLLAATVAVSGDHIVVVYADDSASVNQGGPSGAEGGQAYTAVSHDRGQSWQRERPLAGMDSRPMHRVQIAAQALRFVIEVEVGQPGANRVAYCQSFDGGESFSPVIAVPAPGGDVDHEDAVEGNVLALSSITGTALSAFWERDNGANELFCAGQGLELSIQRYCAAGQNSTGQSALLSVVGSPFLTDNDCVLSVGVVPNDYGIFIMGLQQTSIPFGQGLLCVQGSVHILGGMRQASGGHNHLALDLEGSRVDPGWRHFQYLFRDPQLGAPPFSSSDALRVLFQ